MNETIEKPAKKSSRKRNAKTTAKASGASGRKASSRGRRKAAVEAAMNVTPQVRRQMIAEAAYFRAEARGFAPGHELEDWLAAEQEVDLIISGGARH